MKKADSHCFNISKTSSRVERHIIKHSFQVVLVLPPLAGVARQEPVMLAEVVEV